MGLNKKQLCIWFDIFNFMDFLLTIFDLISIKFKIF